MELVLPDTATLNIFNKVLISLSDLRPDNEPCPIETLIDQCRTVALGGHIVDYDSVLLHCHNCGLIQLRKNIVHITLLGLKFLDSNRERFFEISESQKMLIAEKIVFKGNWNHFARELFQHFEPNFDLETYEFSTLENSLPSKFNRRVHLFNNLGILDLKKDGILVNKRFTELVYQLTADSKAISEQQLEKILMENRKLGARAENAIVEFEKKRLVKLGKDAQAALVKRISTINTAAGYDVESFDGDTKSLVPNRFIEVKATQYNDIRFYWTQNEMNVAKKKKATYWIYFLKEFRESTNIKVTPLMIQNPNKNIKKKSGLSIVATNYLIKEITQIKLQLNKLENLTWYSMIL